MTRAAVRSWSDTPVTYTVTFSEDMDAATVTAADFGNAGTAAGFHRHGHGNHARRLPRAGHADQRRNPATQDQCRRRAE